MAESLDEICTILEPVKDKPEEFHATLNKLLQNLSLIHISVITDSLALIIIFLFIELKVVFSEVP